MAEPHDRAHGWIGSRFVGIPAATGQAAPPIFDASRTSEGEGGLTGNAQNGGGGDWFATNVGYPTTSSPQVQPGQQMASVGQPQFAPYQGTAANSNTQGFVQSKLNDPGLGTTAKYQAGRYLQAHPGDVEGLLRQPGFEGWRQAGSDKITGPGGSTYDVRNANGAVQFTAISGPAWDRNGIAGVNSLGVNSSMANDGIRGNYQAANAAASDAAAAAGQSRMGYAGAGGGGQSAQAGQSSSAPAGNTSGMAMPTAPAVTNLAAPSPFTYQANQQGDFTAPSQTPEMAQQSYNPLAAPTPLSYENLATPEGYKAQEYTGLTAEQLQSDPSYQFRLKAGQDALENTLARTGSLRGGNAANALMEQGQGMASQEYAAADARARATNQMNNATSLGAYQTNAQTGLAYNQNANQNALNFGQANYNQNFQTNQANNQGSNAAIAANNATALAQQGQQYGQSLGAYQTNQAAQNQAYQQALGAYGQNAQTGLQYGAQNQNNALANYQAQTNAALGLGNLNLGFQNSAQNYTLGQGQLGVQQGQLAQQGQNQAFNQAGATYDRNYQANVTDPWAQRYQLASLGRPVVPD